MRPSIYINVHQTLGICLVATALLAYILDVKGVRTSINEAYVRARKETTYGWSK